MFSWNKCYRVTASCDSILVDNINRSSIAEKMSQEACFSWIEEIQDPVENLSVTAEINAVPRERIEDRG